MFITSSMPGGSSCTTEATITRAEAPPMAPASWFSANAPGRRRRSARPATATPRARVVDERPPAPVGPEKAAEQRQQIPDRRGAAPERGPLQRRRAAKDVDEQRRLPVLVRALAAESDTPDVSADVREQAPEQAVRDVGPGR